ncbi:hypothetical protein [Halobacillus naozhouensis]|uniref:Lipoprotein n=1 Tax=Halobacillus naozhouensis TaxID=554880 RepID=A0ABY8IWL5_9BACI|nr:hypothetical protein [Halobacillus naozhouensis]WFT73056.1 hypothetical protein P9989_11610 [Halobacillus naozhouensis]
MKKFLFAIGLISVLVLAGCGSSSSEEKSTSGSEETSSKEKKSDKNAVKEEILNVQMNMANTFRPQHSKIASYQTLVADGESTSEAIKTAGKEALAASEKAADLAESYKIKSDLPKEIKAQYEEALPSLQAYYAEVGKALNKNIENADFTTANEKFNTFQQKLDAVYKDAGLLATDLMAEFS